MSSATSGRVPAAAEEEAAAAAAARAATIKAPEAWPSEVKELYDPVRKLGEGGFAAVVLARRKKKKKKGSVGDEGCNDNGNKENSNDDDGHDEYVAMKVVGLSRKEESELAALSKKKREVGYAHREIEILAELDHPNIVRLIDHWEPPLSTGNSKAAAVMALSYADGPTVNDLIGHGGRLGFGFARVVAAQLVDAVAYLHSRAVVYRDIKPDNIVVVGAGLTQGEVWDDGGRDNASPTAGDNHEEWGRLLRKWHVTLVDFGFARALTPDDMKSQIANSPAGGSRRTLDSSTGSISKSLTRGLVRTMSALGNRAYAAPEVQNGIERNLEASSRMYSSHKSVDVTKTLAENVSVYGLTADSYSLGNTLLHMMTGIRPDRNADEVIAMENSPIVLLCRCLCGGGGGRRNGKDTTTDGGGSPTSSAENGTVCANRQVEYRSFSATPAEVRRLIRGLTHRDPRERTSVRAARMYPWVDDVLVDRDLPWKGINRIDYLQFVLEQKKRQDDAAAKKKGQAAPNEPAVATEQDESEAMMDV